MNGSIQPRAIGLLMPILFAHLRRLRPLIIAHWLMDIAGVVLTVEFNQQTDGTKH